MQVKDGFLLRQVADNYVIIPVGEETLTVSGILSCNETGAFLWRQLETEKTADQLVTALLDEYEVSPEMAAADVERFTGELQSAGLLR